MPPRLLDKASMICILHTYLKSYIAHISIHTHILKEATTPGLTIFPNKNYRLTKTQYQARKISFRMVRQHDSQNNSLVASQNLKVNPIAENRAH